MLASAVSVQGNGTMSVTDHGPVAVIVDLSKRKPFMKKTYFAYFVWNVETKN